jgi:hypothetical protein
MTQRQVHNVAASVHQRLLNPVAASLLKGQTINSLWKPGGPWR